MLPITGIRYRWRFGRLKSAAGCSVISPLPCPFSAFNTVFFFRTKGTIWANTSLGIIRTGPFSTFNAIFQFGTKSAVDTESCRNVIIGSPFSAYNTVFFFSTKSAIWAEPCRVLRSRSLCFNRRKRQENQTTNDDHHIFWHLKTLLIVLMNKLNRCSDNIEFSGK